MTTPAACTSTETDPRQHRHARSVLGDSIEYVCGCINVIDPPSGVLRSVSKCAGHRQDQKEAGELGPDYYRGLGTLNPDEPRDMTEARYVGQLTEALGAIPRAARPNAITMEIGCGISPYMKAFCRAGYAYIGIEPSRWAAEWAREHLGAFIRNVPIEAAILPYPIADVILAAHVIEHLGDAPGIITGLAGMLNPGGELWIVVPDDTDPLNPDHLWFYNAATLHAGLQQSGLHVQSIATRKYIERENFLYARARKPE